MESTSHGSGGGGKRAKKKAGIARKTREAEQPPGPGFGEGIPGIPRAAGSASRATQCPGAARQCQLHKSQNPAAGSTRGCSGPFPEAESPLCAPPELGEDRSHLPESSGSAGPGGAPGWHGQPGAGLGAQEFCLLPLVTSEKSPRKKHTDESREKSPERRGTPTSLPRSVRCPPREIRGRRNLLQVLGILPLLPALIPELGMNWQRRGTFGKAPELAVHGNVKLCEGKNSLERKEKQGRRKTKKKPGDEMREAALGFEVWIAFPALIPGVSPASCVVPRILPKISQTKGPPTPANK